MGSDEEEERTWARPRRQDVRRVLERSDRAAGQAGGSVPRLRPDPAERVQADDRSLPERWPSLVAEAQAAGGDLSVALLKLLEARRQRWCRRWRTPWPLERSDRD